MLRKFVYLDESTLAEYTATLEGGLIAETRTRAVQSGSKGGAVKLKVAEGNMESGKENEHSWTVSDAPEARFERLLVAANDDPDAIGWIEVMDCEADFANAQIGEFISWECDAYIPDLSRFISKGGNTAKKLAVADGVIEAAEAGLLKGGQASVMEQTIRDLKAQLRITKEMLDQTDIKRSVIGEDEDTEWKVFGTLHDECLRVDDIDDERLVIVGKIKRKLALGRWQRIAEMLNFEIVNRAERRRREKQAPPQGKEDEYVAGPAVELDILAIYR